MLINGLVVPPKVEHLIPLLDSASSRTAKRLFAARLQGVLALLVFTDSGLVAVSSAGGHEWSLREIGYASVDRDQSGTITAPSATHHVVWDSRRDGRYFRESLTYWSMRSPAERARDATVPVRRMVAADRVTTLPSVAGTSTRRSFGIVTALTSNAGWTAAHKGSAALDLAISELRVTASDLGANAVVGLQVSAFGAAGGITSVVGGDAVGVLLMGTAVEVVPDDDAAADGSPGGGPT